ncbi:MAG: hypothetical protein JWM99_1574 [Verrucomicrobiales bacterium]|nr:hypothetical protein [Verrucomicrobiales bacterium]
MARSIRFGSSQARHGIDFGANRARSAFRPDLPGFTAVRATLVNKGQTNRQTVSGRLACLAIHGPWPDRTINSTVKWTSSPSISSENRVSPDWSFRRTDQATPALYFFSVALTGLLSGSTTCFSGGADNGETSPFFESPEVKLPGGAVMFSWVRTSSVMSL